MSFVLYLLLKLSKIAHCLPGWQVAIADSAGTYLVRQTHVFKICVIHVVTCKACVGWWSVCWWETIATSQIWCIEHGGGWEMPFPCLYAVQ